MHITEQIAAEPAYKAVDIARTYLVVEMSRIFGDDEFVGKSWQVQNLPDKEVWRLLEALSFSYRLNGMFWEISNPGNNWHNVNLPVDLVLITGIKPEVDKVLYMQGCDNRHPKQFAAYLKDYFAKHPEDDPEGLGEFRPRHKPVAFPTIHAAFQPDNGEIHCMDGAHRLMELVQQGQESIDVFCAVPNGKPAKSRIGDSTFWLLRKLYEDHPEHRRAIQEVTQLLGRNAVDGFSAIHNYWQRHSRDSSVKAAADRLLSGIQPDAQ